MLRELKVFLDQLERDVLRAQGAEGNLTVKYQVSQAWKDTVHCYITSCFNRDIYHLSPRVCPFILKAFKSFRVQYEMKKKQTDPLLQPVNKEGKLSVDQALVKQAWDRVSARVIVLHNIFFYFSMCFSLPKLLHHHTESYHNERSTTQGSSIYSPPVNVQCGASV